MRIGRRFAVTALTPWAFGALLTAAAASPAPVDDGPRHARRASRGAAALGEYLGLTDGQKASWKALHERHREEMKPLLEEGRTLRQRLRAAVEATSPDPAAVGEATLALEAHRKAVKARREAFQAEVEGLLDPQQKEKLEAWKAARKSLRPGRGDRHPRGVRRPPAPGAPAVEG